MHNPVRLTAMSAYRTAIVTATLTTFSLFFFGCDAVSEDKNASISTSAASSVRGEVDGSAAQTLHAKFAELSEVAPGFGGVFLDEEERPNILLTNPDLEESALHVLRELSSIEDDGRVYTTSLALRDISELENTLQIVKADYDYSQLWDAYQQIISASAGVEGLISADISSKLNRIVIYVESLETERYVSTLITPLNLLELVVFEHGDPFTTDTDLNQKIRPVAGGMRVQFSGLGGCSFGFNASRSPEFGFVTASHCTSAIGQTTYESAFQPSPNNFIALEENDPAFFSTSGCPSGTSCRYSDAVYSRYFPDFTDYASGSIVQTQGIGSTTLISSSPSLWFKIVGIVNYPLEGERVDKMGQITGWTYGFVKDTCSGPYVYPGNRRTLCQVTADYGRDGGDSGGPVFKLTGNRFDVLLYGIHAGSGAGVAVFSSIRHVLNELTIAVAY